MKKNIRLIEKRDISFLILYFILAFGFLYFFPGGESTENQPITEEKSIEIQKTPFKDFRKTETKVEEIKTI